MPTKPRNMTSDTSPRKERTSPRLRQSPDVKRLYPDLPLEDSEDETDHSWRLPSPGEVTLSSTMTSSDFTDSSYMESSPAADGRRPLRGSDSSFSTPRLRSGKVYGAHSFSDQSDDSPRAHRSPKNRRTVTSDTQNNSLIVIAVVFCAVLCIVVAGIVYSQKGRAVASPEQPKVYEQFKVQMSALRTKFPSQSDQSWKKLRLATKHILDDPRPVYPAVILMVGSENSLPAMSCIGTQMVATLNRLYNVTRASSGEAKILVSDLNRRTPAQEKKDLDEKLQEVFTSGSKGAMLVNIQQLSPEAVLMLHSYCDNDNAPFTNVLLILQLVTDSLAPDELQKQEAVEQFMLNLWKNKLGVDEVMALFSRIANNIIVISPENSASLKDACG